MKHSRSHNAPTPMRTRLRRLTARTVLTAAGTLLATAALAAPPKIIVISLDGATPRIVKQYTDNGTLNPNRGLGLLQKTGVAALQNTTVSPSLTAVAHIAIATGSTAANNDILANTFHLVASPFLRTISGFSAPIGGYQFSPLGEDATPTAEPVWISLRAAGKHVVTATFPGGDGLDITVPGLTGSPIIQSSSKRTVDYTVPFGAFIGPGEKGFALGASDFASLPSGDPLLAALTAAGKTFYGDVKAKTTPLETFTTNGVSFTIRVLALDTTNDGVANYDTLVFYNQAQGIQPGPFSPPSTGPAYVKASEKKSSPFFLEGTPNKAGTSYYVSNLAPDLSTVRLIRYSTYYIPRNAPVIADVDDINNHVGFWRAQADFRIPERIDATPSTFASFPDQELEDAYEDQVKSFVDYQTRVALRAISQQPDADVVFVYIEQPDGSEHQFLLTDPRQATNPADPTTIGANQDAAKKARYAAYVGVAYNAANEAVQRIIDAVGTDAAGRPNSNVFVTSDHGFNIFHTTVALNNLLAAAGIDSTKARAVTSGPAANIYISLKGREPNGTVLPADYPALQQQIVDALNAAVDTNPNYTDGATSVPVFSNVYARPFNASDAVPGLRTTPFIGQDGGDVYALLTPGYNFDGIQGAGVIRLGDPASATPILSVPNFYGAHGYDPTFPNMSAIFYAAGPNIGQGTLSAVNDIDIAPTISALLGVPSAPTVDGTAITFPTLQLTGITAVAASGSGGFNINLPLVGGVNGRRSGASGAHTLTFTASRAISGITSASLTSGTGSVGSASFSGNTITVNLTGVADAQNLTLQLNGVTFTGGTSPATIAVSLGVLLGDVNGDGVVNATDVALVKAATSAPAGAAQARYDVNGNGSVTASDVALVKANLGHHLP